MQKTLSIIPFQGVERFLAIPAYVVPRALWRDKPLTTLGNWFGIVYLNQPEFSTSSAAITIFGESYMYVGWIGTILACLVLGVQLAAVYRFTAGAGLWAVYLALVPTFIDVEAQFTTMFVTLIQQTAFFLILYWALAWFSDPQRLRSSSARPKSSGVVGSPRDHRKRPTF